MRVLLSKKITKGLPVFIVFIMVFMVIVTPLSVMAQETGELTWNTAESGIPTASDIVRLENVDENMAVDMYGEDGPPNITPEHIKKQVEMIKEQYPEGMPFTNANPKGGYIYSVPIEGITYKGFGCAAFAFILNDAIFGKGFYPVTKYYDYTKARVGDILRINNNTHSVVVLEVKENSFIVAEGNYNSSIHWGREIYFNSINFTYGLTRYQEEYKEPVEDVSELAITDVRTQKTIKYDASKPAVFVFGSPAYCQRTQAALRDLQMLIEDYELDFQVFALSHAYNIGQQTITDKDLIDKTAENGITNKEKICIGWPEMNNSLYKSIYDNTYEIMVAEEVQSWPFIGYLNSKGEVVVASEGSTKLNTIISNLERIGITFDISESIVKFDVEGLDLGDIADNVIEYINERMGERTKITSDTRLNELAKQKGLSSLLFDVNSTADFLDTNGNMIISDESVVYEFAYYLTLSDYSDYIKPQIINVIGSNAYKLIDKYYDEMFYDTKAVGLDVFYNDGKIGVYFVLGNKVTAEEKKRTDEKCTREFVVNSKKVRMVSDNVSFDVNASGQIKAYLYTDQASILVKNSSFNFSPSNTDIKVDSNGVVTADAAATGDIRLEAKSNQLVSILCNVTATGTKDTTNEEETTTEKETETQPETSVEEESTTEKETETQPETSVEEENTTEKETETQPETSVEEESTNEPSDKPSNPAVDVNMNGLYLMDGEWYLYEKGLRNTGFTGLYNDANCGWWLVCEGKVAFDYNGLWCDPVYGWWKIVNGMVDFGYTGLYNDANCGWWLIGGGRICFEYNGLWCDPTYGWWKIVNGTVDFGYTGLFYDANCGWWLIGGGRICFEYNGLWCDSTYGWWKIVNGIVDFGYTGLYYDANCGWWLIGNGNICFGYTGYWDDPIYGIWYVNNGLLVAY